MNSLANGGIPVKNTKVKRSCSSVQCILEMFLHICKFEKTDAKCDGTSIKEQIFLTGGLHCIVEILINFKLSNKLIVIILNLTELKNLTYIPKFKDTNT